MEGEQTAAASLSDRNGVLLLLLYLVAFAVACSSFSPVWNYSAHSYWPSSSPYSLLKHGAAGKVSDRFTFKVYKDVVVYYCTMIAMVVLGVLSRHGPRQIRVAVHHRVGLRQLHAALAKVGLKGWSPYPYGATVGELLFVACMLGLTAWWIYFWSSDYPRIRHETGVQPTGKCCADNITGTLTPCPAAADAHAELQVWARVTGHVSNLLMSFALFPVARNSLWESSFGIPFERAVRYHRTAGGLAWLSVTVHMGLWFAKWRKDQMLLHNMASLSEMHVSAEVVHWDNFTIPLVELAWLGLTGMVMVAVLFRRSNFEWFYLTHHFAASFLLAAIMHAWSLWYYAGGPILLWVADKCVRMTARGTAPAAVLAIEPLPQQGLTKIELSKTAFAGSVQAGGDGEDAAAFRHGCMQYAFVCVPEVSQHEWHPFTISSAPSSPTSTFHIKAMGPGTFTHRLHTYANRGGGNIRHGGPTVLVDGPYGRSPALGDYEHLVLVAGGIGFTPMHSILAELALRLGDGSIVAAKSCGKIKAVRLVWVARSEALFRLGDFKRTLHELYSVSDGDDGNHPDIGFGGGGGGNDDGFTFDAKLYCTAKGGGQSAAAPHGSNGSSNGVGVEEFIVRYGRPTLASAIPRVRRGGGRTLVLACGPAPLVASASRFALDRRYNFHHEVFNW